MFKINASYFLNKTYIPIDNQVSNASTKRLLASQETVWVVRLFHAANLQWSNNVQALVVVCNCGLIAVSIDSCVAIINNDFQAFAGLRN